MQLKDVAPLATRIKENVQKVMIGKENNLTLVLTALLAGGHILMEDVPGTGKTVLAKSVTRSIDCDFKRVQFTPDILPSDVTGQSVFDQKEVTFTFRQGPVFTNILLADEINRATPRSQSALLECMEEKQVSADGVTYPLPAPFLVIATQNPVEIQGTFPLPEAQLDRFFIRLKMGYPDVAQSNQMLSRFIKDNPLDELTPVATGEEIIQAQALIRTVQVSSFVLDYISRLVEQTRSMDSVTLGVSPRGALALLRGVQAYAAIQGRDFATPEDVRLMAVPVLAHRLVVRTAYGKHNQNEEAIQDALRMTAVPTEDVETA